MATSIREYAIMCAEVYSGLRCTSKRSFYKWAFQLRVHNPQSVEEIQKEFCEDCTLSYELLMQSEGRCVRPDDGWELENPHVRRKKLREHERSQRGGAC